MKAWSLEFSPDSFQRNSGEAPERLAGGVDDQPDRSEHCYSKDWLDAFGTEDHAAGGDFAHHLNLRETESILVDTTVRHLVALATDRLDACTRQVRRGSHRICRTGVDEKSPLVTGSRCPGHLERYRYVNESHLVLVPADHNGPILHRQLEHDLCRCGFHARVNDRVARR